MKNKNILLSLVVMGALGSTAFAEDPHWGYTGHEGPDAWGSLSPKYKECSEGKNQSPINVVHSMEANLEPLTLDYKSGSMDIVNNGHTVQVDLSAGNTLTIDGTVFELKQFHFHTPSENEIEGKVYPLEAHFVHLDKDGNIAVLALMFEEGEENKALAKEWAHMPKNAGDKIELKLDGIAKAMLPENLEYYRFNGSLTTPPCTEGVRWFVLKTSVTVSKAQVEQFAAVVHQHNNRPIQPLNARMIVK